MKKSKNLKRIGAVMLSLVLAVSTVFTTTAVSEKKVSAQAEIKNKKQLQRWALATKLLSDGEKYFDQTKADNKISDKTAAIYTAIEYIWNPHLHPLIFSGDALLSTSHIRLHLL